MHGLSSGLAFRALIREVVKYCSYTEQALTSPGASWPLCSLLFTSSFNRVFNGSPYPCYSSPRPSGLESESSVHPLWLLHAIYGIPQIVATLSIKAQVPYYSCHSLSTWLLSLQGESSNCFIHR